MKFDIAKTLATLTLAGAAIPAFALEVIVAHPVTVGVAEDILKDTGVKVLKAAPDNLPASRQLAYFEGKGKDDLANMAKEADAVITVRSIFPKEKIYPLTRRSNIKIIPIDIGVSMDGENSGVALNDKPIEEHQVWLNLSNLQSMYETFTNEMARVDPKLEKKMEANLQKKVKEIRGALLDAQEFLGELDEEPGVLVLDEAVDYLPQGLELPFVDATIPSLDDKKAVDAFKKTLANNGVKIAVGTKKISDDETKLLEDSGVKFIRINRLKSGDPLKQVQAVIDEIKADLK